MMEAYIPLLCLGVITAMLWFSVLKRRAAVRPVVWTWPMVGAVALGAFAVPVMIAAAILSS